LFGEMTTMPLRGSVSLLISHHRGRGMCGVA